MQRRANEWSEEEIEEWTKASEIFSSPILTDIVTKLQIW